MEHLFIGELLRSLWRSGEKFVEVLKPQVDDAGYDLLFELEGQTRHVQLKSSYRDSKTANQKVHLNLASKRSGCVIWMLFDRETLELGPFLWFGGRPGEGLPSLKEFKVARHTKGNAEGYKAERPMIRVVPKSKFEQIDSTEELLVRLFGQ